MLRFQTLNGIARQEERWKMCVAETDYQFPYAVGRLYVDVKFTQNDKQRVGIVHCLDQVYFFSFSLFLFDPSRAATTPRHLVRGLSFSPQPLFSCAHVVPTFFASLSTYFL